MSSDVTPWMPTVCAGCGRKIRKSVDNFMAHYSHVTCHAVTVCGECILSGRLASIDLT